MDFMQCINCFAMLLFYSFAKHQLGSSALPPVEAVEPGVAPLSNNIQLKESEAIKRLLTIQQGFWTQGGF